MASPLLAPPVALLLSAPLLLHATRLANATIATATNARRLLKGRVRLGLDVPARIC
jgi:hypothetical protein